MKRIFFAVKIEPDNYLTEVVRTFKLSLNDEKIKWTVPDNYHITLAFLGDTEEEKIEMLGDLAEECCAGSGEFDFFLRGAGVFRSPKEPRVIWVGIQESEKLIQLAELVNSAVKKSGIIIEEKSFRPHLTIGRLKKLQSLEIFKSLLKKYEDTEIQNISVTEVVLFESITRPTGPVYNALRKFRVS
jgi:2'-5' RNA ligase